MDVKADVLIWLVSTAIPIISLYFSNKSRIKESENRMTVLEMEVKHLSKRVNHNVGRLDKHDEQTRATLALVEQVRHLTATVEEVKQDVKSLTLREG